jgi:hypothetical protein
MIRPANFGFNSETAINNAFQSESLEGEMENIREQAIEEFDNMVDMMREAGIHVHVWQDTVQPIKPDAVFPNNWFSTIPNGSLLTYPMFAKNRRIERDPDILDHIEQLFHVERRYTFEHYEEEDLYLEGTGSMIIDHDEGVIYACLSPRTSIQLLDKMAILAGYKMIVFNSVDADGMPIYHTNVMMALGVSDAVICLSSIPNENEKANLIKSIKSSGRDICDISFQQMNQYAGNMIQLLDDQDDAVLIMSKQAYDSLHKDQIRQLSKNSKIVAPDIKTIETYGGGSARCMIAEIFLEERDAIA